MAAKPICPKCGKPIVRKPRHYRDGNSEYIHKITIKTIPFRHEVIWESCTVKRENVVPKESL